MSDAGCNFHPYCADTDDSLGAELRYLTRLIDRRPTVVPVIVQGLAALDDETCVDLQRLMADRMVRVRRRPSKPRSSIATRAAAVVALVVSAQAIAPIAPAAAAPEFPPESRAATRAVIAVSVVDAATGQPIAFALVRAPNDDLVSFTDENGRAMVPAEALLEPVLILEHEVYRLTVVEVHELAAGQVIKMERMAQLAEHRPPAVEVLPPGYDSRPPRVPADLTLPPRPARPTGAKRPARQANVTRHVAASVAMPAKPIPATFKVRHAVRPAPPPRVVTTVEVVAAANKVTATAVAKATEVAATTTEVAAVLPAIAVAVEDRLAKTYDRAKAQPDRPLRAARENVYVVRSGDTLGTIADRMLGSALRWPQLLTANRDRIANPHRLAVDMELRIPAMGPVTVVPITPPGAAARVAPARPAAHVTPARPAAPVQAAIPAVPVSTAVPAVSIATAVPAVPTAKGQTSLSAAGSTYVVRPGDSLSAIAAAHLGSRHKWRELWLANRHVVRYPTRINPGQRLVLPGKLVVAPT